MTFAGLDGGAGDDAREDLREVNPKIETAPSLMRPILLGLGTFKVGIDVVGELPPVEGGIADACACPGGLAPLFLCFK